MARDAVVYYLSVYAPDGGLFATSRGPVRRVTLPDRVPRRSIARRLTARGSDRARIVGGRDRGKCHRAHAGVRPGVEKPLLLSLLLLPPAAAVAERRAQLTRRVGFQLLVFLISAAVAGRLALRSRAPSRTSGKARARRALNFLASRSADESWRLVRAFLSCRGALRADDALSREKGGWPAARALTRWSWRTGDGAVCRESGGGSLGGGAPGATLEESFRRRCGCSAPRSGFSASFVSTGRAPLRRAVAHRDRPLPVWAKAPGWRHRGLLESCDNRLAAWAENSRIIAHESRTRYSHPAPVGTARVWIEAAADARVLARAPMWTNVLTQQSLKRAASEFCHYAILPRPISVRRTSAA